MIMPIWLTGIITGEVVRYIDELTIIKILLEDLLPNNVRTKLSLDLQVHVVYSICFQEQWCILQHYHSVSRHLAHSFIVESFITFFPLSLSLQGALKHLKSKIC